MYCCEQEDAVGFGHIVELVCGEEIDGHRKGIERRRDEEGDTDLDDKEYAVSAHCCCGLLG